MIFCRNYFPFTKSITILVVQLPLNLDNGNLSGKVRRRLTILSCQDAKNLLCRKIQKLFSKKKDIPIGILVGLDPVIKTVLECTDLT